MKPFKELIVLVSVRRRCIPEVGKTVFIQDSSDYVSFSVPVTNCS